jgi:flagellar basal body-associated protein FliL
MAQTRLKICKDGTYTSVLDQTLKDTYSMRKGKKTKLEWVIIISLAVIFASVWLLAHWNLSRQPPHHKGPGSVGYEDPVRKD